MNSEILSKAIEHYGIENQLLVAMEEANKFSQAISKYLRSKCKDDDVEVRQHIIEEMADVLIMAEQVKMILAIQDYEIELYKDYKLNRLNNRIKELMNEQEVY